MINWKKLVGEVGLVQFAGNFMMVGQAGTHTVPIGIGPQGAGIAGSAPDMQLMVTAFLPDVHVVAFDESTGDITFNYESLISSSPASRPMMELHVDAKDVLYFVKANQIALASSFVGPDGKPIG